MRLKFVAIVLLAPCFTLCAAPLPPEAKEKDIPKIEGTMWSGDGVVAPTIYFFEKGGTLTYSYNGATYSNGTWKQTGDAIYWEANKRYCEFEGKIEGNVITGKSWNVTGKEWKLTIKLDKDAKMPAPPLDNGRDG